MLAYKFRSPAQFSFALDIIYHQRLYCAKWETLNDPMEGAFYFQSPQDAERVRQGIEQVIDHKQRIRIASLAGTFDCHLLWAHYAAGFSGLAVEVALPEDPKTVRRVEYRGLFAELRMSQRFDANAAAETVLGSKYNEWRYEREIRILYREHWFPLPSPPTRIIAGHRMDESLFKGLLAICKDLDIPLCRTNISNDGISADNVWSPEPRMPLTDIPLPTV